MNGPITNVTVTLHRFGHAIPTEIDILLVSPAGDTVMLMSDACGGGDDIEDSTLIFTQQAPRAMSFDSSDCGEFTYRPTNYDGAFDGPNDSMTSPARSLWHQLRQRESQRHLEALRAGRHER